MIFVNNTDLMHHW